MRAHNSLCSWGVSGGVSNTTRFNHIPPSVFSSPRQHQQAARKEFACVSAFPASLPLSVSIQPPAFHLLLTNVSVPSPHNIRNSLIRKGSKEEINKNESEKVEMAQREAEQQVHVPVPVPAEQAKQSVCLCSSRSGPRKHVAHSGTTALGNDARCCSSAPAAGKRIAPSQHHVRLGAAQDDRVARKARSHLHDTRAMTGTHAQCIHNGQILLVPLAVLCRVCQTFCKTSALARDPLLHRNFVARMAAHYSFGRIDGARDGRSGWCGRIVGGVDELTRTPADSHEDGGSH